MGPSGPGGPGRLGSNRPGSGPCGLGPSRLSRGDRLGATLGRPGGLGWARRRGPPDLLAGREGVGLGVELLILGVERLGGGAVKGVPPDAGEDLLVEDGSIRAEEGPLLVGKALVPRLAAGLDVSVHAGGAAGAVEAGVGCLVEDGVVHAGLT